MLGHRAVSALDPCHGGCDGHLTRRAYRLSDAAANDGVLVGICRTNTPWFVIKRGVINRVVNKRVVIKCWC